MKGKKLDLIEVTRTLNVLRENFKGTWFSRPQFVKMLAKALGLQESSAGKYISRFVNYEIVEEIRKGTSKQYRMKDVPQYHKDKVANALSGKSRNRERDIQDAIRLLKNEGYKISRRSKLNIEKMKGLLGDQIKDCYDYEEI